MKKLYDLTNPQKSIWVTEEFYKGTSIDNIAGTANISEEVNFDKLKEAINIFVKTNDSFRLKFIRDNGEIKQFIDDFSPFSFETVNVSTDKDVKKIEDELSKTPLDLLDSYLFKIKLFRFENGHGGFVIVMHHLIVDAWAAGLVISRIIDIYDALLSNTFVLENFSNPSYTEYISSEQKYLESNKFEKDKTFWNDTFQTIPETVTFPSTSAGSNMSTKAKRKLFKIPNKTMDFINSFCQKNKISPFNFFMGIYGVYLSKVSNLDEFVIGTPILNRSNVKEKHTVGMFISVVPFKLNLNHEDSFAKFTSGISADFFNIFRHQKYPYQTLLEDLRKQNVSIPNLYNVVLSYQNMRNNSQGTKTHYEAKWLVNGNISEDMEIHFFDINDTGIINVAYDYKTSKYTSEDIYALHSRILHIINQIIENNEILLKELEIITPDEKNKILNEFNNTKTIYPKNNTVIEIFEEQSRKNPEMTAVVFEDKKLTYSELNEKANSLALCLKNNGLKTNDVVGLFLDKSLESIVSILATLKCGATFMPIDINYPEQRISFMLSDAKCKIVLSSCDLTNRLDFLNKGTKLLNIDLSNEDIYGVTCSNIFSSSTPDTPVYIMYTSGSTGNPKGVLVTNKNIVRLVKNTNYIKFEKNERILQTGSIVFDACTFEIWGALLNGFELYIIKKQDLLDPTLLEQYLHKNKITILWLTAPLFNQLSEDNPNMFDSVRILLTGGDVLSPRHINMVREACPNLTIINGYGPTENTTFSTCFTIDKTYEDAIPIGFPIANSTCYVVSQSLSLLPVGIAGELLVGGDGVSNGYLNNPDFTAKKFIPNPFEEGMLYKTGDLVKWRADGSIDFIGRVDNQVKVRGFRVELNEITLKIQDFNGIRECITVVKNINGEKVICSYFSSNKEINIDELKETLRSSLPHYSIPTYFIELENLPINVNGKVDTKKLPEPKILNSKTKILPARNEIDSKLIDLLKVLLNINSISIDDSFFELGGDSLSAINFCSQIQNEFNVQLFVKDVLEHPTIQEISDIISKNLDNVTSCVITPVEKQDSYPTSSAQKRMYFASTMAGESVLYNIPGGIILDGNIDVKKLENCFNALISRHEALRTYFVFENGNVIQKIANKINFKLEVQENVDFDELNSTFKNFIKPFDLSQAPLFRSNFIKFNNEKSALFIDMHHIISDGTSLAIFIDELCNLYNGESLPKLNITYKDFAVFENSNLTSDNMQEAEKYWVSQFEDDIPVLNLPTNYPRPAIQSFEGAKIYSSIDLETKQKIEILSKKLGVTPYMVLLSAYYILLSKYTAQEDIVVGSPIVGRNLSETYNLIGMFVNTLALRCKINYNQTFKEFLDTVKINCLNAYKYQTYPFDKLVESLNIKKDTSKNPLFDTMFIYQNNGFKNVSFKNVSAKYYIPDTNISKFDLSIELIPNDDRISISFEYATKLFDEVFIKNLSNHYLNILNTILDNYEIKISDIDMLSEEEINKIMYDFNNTEANYPKDKTIVQLFEEQVEKTPDNIAVVFEKKQLTYRELNDKANSLANYLRKNGIGRNDVVALRIDKSIEMVSSILGIIKSGACYLPINLSYPEERVNFMLKDSNAKYLLCDQNSSGNIRTNISKIFIDFENQEIYSEATYNLPLVNTPEDLLYIIYTSGSTGTPKGAMLMHKNVVRLMKNDKFLFDFNSKDVWTMFHSVAFDFSVWEMYGALLYGGKLIVVPDYTAKDPNLFLDLMEKEGVTVLNQTPTYFYNLLNCEIRKVHSNLKIRYIIFGGEALKPTLISPWRNLHPKTKLINMYGITETTVHVTFKELSDDDLKHPASNIGVPIPTLKVLLLDKHLKLVPLGVPGEICVCGDGVFKGYLNRPDLNKTKLIKNPYNKNEVLYRSADSAILTYNNSLEYIGRIDNQVKIRGFRVELGEIEEKILKFPNIKSCVVTTKNINNSHDLLCAYYISDKVINLSDLRNHLQKHLPNYMVPQHFIKIEKWPYNHNGKINKNALPLPFSTATKDIILPRNETDSALVDLLKKLLNINNISIEDDFFDLGGDSLSAINLCAQIQNEFNVQLFVKDILEHPIIQDISDIIINNLDNKNKLLITPAEKQDFYPVSSAQKRIYFASNMAGDNSILYNIPGGIILTTEIDVNKLEKCFAELINRHESLRTYFTFEDDNVVQKITEKIDFKLEVQENIDFSNLNLMFKDFVKPFNLSMAPLFRAKFIKFNNKKSTLFVDMHHIISDGTSLSIFIDELCKLYNNETLSELNITYKDFAVFENNMISSDTLKEAEDYWVNQFIDDIPVLNLPTNYSRPAVQSFEGSKVYSSIDLETKQKIDVISKKLGVTPYMVLLSAYYILLSKYTSQDDIVVGSPIVGRDLSETYNLIGMFVNTLALRCKFTPNQTFKEFLETVKTNCLNAYKYQTYPFDELVNKLNIRRDASRSPLFDTMFTYQNNGLKNIFFNNTSAEYYIPDTNISKFDLSIELIPSAHGISVSFEYATKLFKEDFIKNLSNHYLNILNIILENNEINLSDICMLNDDEKNKILNNFNDTALDYPKDLTVVQIFEEQVEKNPDGIAVIFENKKLTYRELNAKANSIAHFLKQNDIGRTDIVPVFMNRSLDLIIIMMGIIKAGAAYLPIAVETPAERLDFILQNSRAKMTFVKSSQNLIYNETIKIVDIEQFDYSKYSTKNINAEIKPLDLLYVIYTSGSTGNPKGVKVCHHNLVNFVKSFNEQYSGISCDDKLLASTNISFDVSIFEFFMTLLNGAKLYLYNEPNINDIFKYCKTIIREKITFLYIPPNILEDVYSILSTYSNIPINKMLLGVEPIKSSTIKKYYTLNPNMQIINAYGPTEATICSTSIKLDNDILKKYKIIPIGRPLHNLQIYILDKHEQPVPVGVPGEIYVAGANVARGYLNNRELTDKNFVSLPGFNCKLAYKTGDLAKWNDDGLISFIGRNDFQVKVNGHRIELGEIESCIYLYPNIDKALVLLDKNNKLICYFSSSKQININDLKAFMQRKLPLYFIPNFFVQIEKFKLTANGKIDRKALAKIKVDFAASYEEPTTPYQKSLAEAFETVLGIDKVGITDNFFELGGDSLLAIKLQIEAFNKGLDLSYKDIFKYPTIKQLSENVSSTKSKDDEFKDDYNYTKINEILKNNVFNNKEKISKNKFKNVLLTGSTGFLGSHILDALMKNTKCNVYCLIRAKDNNDPQIRLLNTLRFYFGNKYDRQIFNRIIVIEGDIKDEKLGLNDLYYEELGTTIDLVINSAAIVKHYGNIDTFNATNIQGAKNIIKFCTDFNCKLYHLSTLSVSGNIFETDSYKVAEFSNNITFNEQSLYIGQDLSNVYIYTKFIAERLILEHIIDGSLDAKIIRLGNITNRYSDGIFQINVTENAFLNRINSFLHIGCIPDYLSDKYTEFTPVDLCAEAIIKLISYNCNFTIYHIYNNNHITFKELSSILNSLKIKMDLVDKETFNKKIRFLSKDDKTKKIISGIINDFDENKNLVYNTNIKIQNNFTNKILKKLSFKWPKINEKYLKKYIIYLKSIGYIK